MVKEELKTLKHCRTDKEIKKTFKLIASKDPDTYFPTKELKELGYMRMKCSYSTYFWITVK